MCVVWWSSRWSRVLSDSVSPFLSFAFLTHEEKTTWLTKVDQYTQCISNTMQRSCFFNFLMARSSLPLVDLSPKPSSLHTGSLASQLGKPLMLLADLPRVVSDSLPELRSDHDVMFSLDHLPVSEKTQSACSHRLLTEEPTWLMAQVSPYPGTEEFVRLFIMKGREQRHSCIPNTAATDYMVTVVKETFFTPEGELTAAARGLPVMCDSREMCSCVTAPLYSNWSYKFLVERAGPSVNLKVTVHRGRVVFDCDLLLSLPLLQWPSPAQEWLTRPRLWPSRQTVAQLAALPCHLIPKPRKEGDDESWRFSFSNQELQLAAALPHRARLCYVGLKLIFKKQLKDICPGLKSYHLLTAFLWFMEEQDPSSWYQRETQEENVLGDKDMDTLVDNLELDWTSSFSTILKPLETRIILAKLLWYVSRLLRSGRLPHYFIKTVNLHPGITRAAGLQLLKVAVRMEELVKRGPEACLKDTLLDHFGLLNPGLMRNLMEQRTFDPCNEQTSHCYSGESMLADLR